MSYEEYFASRVPVYENDFRLASLTMALLGVAAVAAVALLIWAVMVA